MTAKARLTQPYYLIERRLVLGKLLELEDLPLLEGDEALVEARLAGRRGKPGSSVPLAVIFPVRPRHDVGGC